MSSLRWNRWTVLYLALSGIQLAGACLALAGNRHAGVFAGGSVLVHAITDVLRTMGRR